MKSESYHMTKTNSRRIVVSQKNIFARRCRSPIVALAIAAAMMPSIIPSIIHAADPPASTGDVPTGDVPGIPSNPANPTAADKNRHGNPHQFGDAANTDPSNDSPQNANPPSTNPPSTDLSMPLDGREGRDLSVANFRPIQKLVAPVHPLARAKYAAIDIHTHFFHRLKDNLQSLRDVVAMMDRNNIAVCVSLDGTLGDRLESHHAFLMKHFPDRFAIMANVDWRGDGDSDDPATWDCHRHGFADRTAAKLRLAAEAKQIVGLKVFKRFGLGHKNPDGSLIAIDDPRFDPIWAACGELGLPVLMHTADPVAFFDPIGPTNERWEELSRHPDWSFAGDEFPSYDELLDARNRLIRRHRGTTFICAHMASCPQDLVRLDRWLGEHPNMMTEFASRISELGRQERASRAFIIKHADRVLFGTDGPWPEKRLSAYWRFLETEDESFDYSEKDPPPQGLWRIDGMKLPDDVLRKIYQDNAIALIPALAEKVRVFESTP